jgi:hypothetical protein
MVNYSLNEGFLSIRHFLYLCEMLMSKSDIVL